MRKAKGITLIALVITIVVLIILAGVAISLTLGDNGIFKKATTAREDYGIAAAKEKIELKIAELQAEKEGKATLEELVEYLKDDPSINYTVSLTKITASLTAEITVGDAEEIYLVYNKYQFKVNKKLKVEYISKVEIEETAEPTEIEASSYGEYIDYPIDLNGDGDTTNDWMIFYQKSDTSGKLDTYIIAADYLKNTDSRLNLNATGMTTASTYGMCWSSAPSMQTTNQNSLFMATKYALNSSNANSKAASTLLNTSNWEGYVNTTYADYAIGSPTLEMWVASWNDKYEKTLKLFTNTNENGYYIGNSEGTTSDAIGISSVTEAYRANSLYFPRTTVDSGCDGCRLASPAAFSTTNLMRVEYDGTVSSSFYDSNDYCVRPLVHLKSNISLEQNSDRIWVKN